MKTFSGGGRAYALNMVCYVRMLSTHHLCHIIIHMCHIIIHICHIEYGRLCSYAHANQYVLTNMWKKKLEIFFSILEIFFSNQYVFTNMWKPIYTRALSRTFSGGGRAYALMSCVYLGTGVRCVCR